MSIRHCSLFRCTGNSAQKLFTLQMQCYFCLMQSCSFLIICKCNFFGYRNANTFLLRLVHLLQPSQIYAQWLHWAKITTPGCYKDALHFIGSKTLLILYSGPILGMIWNELMTNHWSNSKWINQWFLPHSTCRSPLNPVHNRICSCFLQRNADKFTGPL